MVSTWTWETWETAVMAELLSKLHFVQRGYDPSDWKPMKDVGPGVKEIRVHDATGAFRVIYLATRPEGVYVLHCFQKKTWKTRKANVDLTASRLRQIGD